LNATGHASDNDAIAAVWYQLNWGGWNLATSTNDWRNWSTPELALVPSTNVIAAYAIDNAGNTSATNIVSFVNGAADVTSAVTGQITLPFKFGGLAFDATNGVFYASARFSTNSFSSSLVTIAPYSGAITVVTNFAAEPGTLVLDSERRVLYVAIPSQNAARRFDLSSGKLGAAFDVGGAVKEMVVMPGFPERLAVVRKDDLSLGVYEGGGALPVTGIDDYVSLICPGADGSRLYGYNLNTTAYTFYRIAVDTNGVSLVEGSNTLFPLPGSNMRFAGGRLYSGSGWIADPEAKSLVGQFADAATGDFVLPELARNRIYFLKFQWPDSTVYACEPGSFQTIASGTITNTTWTGSIFADEAYVHDFQRWGEDGFACRTYDKLHIVRTSLVPTKTSVDLGLALSTAERAVTNLQVFSYDINCTNSGPAMATNAVVQFTLPPETAFVSAVNNRGPYLLDLVSNAVTFTLTNLPANASASIRISVRVQSTNTTALLASVNLSTTAVDTDEKNNFGVLLTTANWNSNLEHFNLIGSIVPNDATYSPATAKVYFTFNRNAGRLANLFIGFDPLSGIFDRPVFLAGDPQKTMRATDSTNLLEVAMNVPGDVRRVNLISGEVTNQLSLPRWQEIQSKNEAIKEQDGIRFTQTTAVNIANNQLLGQFSFVLFAYHLFEPDVRAQRFYQIAYGDGPARLRIFDLATFRLLNDIEFPPLPISFRTFVRWGSDGFLVVGDQGVTVWRSRLVPYNVGTDLQAEISSTPGQVLVNDSFTITASVRNSELSLADNVLLRISLPTGATVLNTSATAGVLTLSNSLLTLTLDQLGPSAKVTVAATLQATNVGSFLATAVASSQNVDTNSINDMAVCSTVVTTPSGWPQVDSAITLPLAVNDLLYEPVSQKLYASVGSAAGAQGNSIFVIDPATGRMKGCWLVGSEPRRLAASDDGQYLYVSLTGAGAVGRIRLSDGVLDQRFSLGSASDVLSAGDIAVRPGHPDTIAAATYYGVTMYRNGEALTNFIYNFFDFQVIAFNETGDKLFSFGNVASDFPFSVVDVTDDGLGAVTQFGGLMVGFGETFRYEAGLVFGTIGIVFDPITKIPRGILPGVSRSGGLAPHAAANRAYGMIVDGTNALVRAYDITTVRLMGQQSFPAAIDYPEELQRCGEKRLAYHTMSSVVILRSSLVPSGPVADLGLYFDSPPTRVDANQSFKVHVAVTNSGPAMATNCVVAVNLPSGVSLLSANCDDSWSPAETWYSCPLSALTNGEVREWELALSNGQSGLKFLQAFVQADVTDTNPANDVVACFIPSAPLEVGSRDQLPLPARSLVYSPARARFYAAIPPSIPFYGNSVMEIDPVNGTVRGPLFVGSEPVVLAPSDDGTSLFVSLYGLGAMKRIDLNSWAVTQTFAVGAGVEDAVALPGTSNGVVLTHGEDAAVFLNGVRTSYVVDPSVSRLVRGADSRLYGFNPSLGMISIQQLAASSASITLQDSWQNVFFGSGVDLRFAAGKLFSNRGDVLDPEAKTITGILPRFNASAFTPESDGTRLYSYADGQLALWDTVDFQALGSIMISDPSSAITDLARWGNDGLGCLEDDLPTWFRCSFPPTPPGATLNEQRANESH
jgi:uncharacterized repeat protein (TIGR01451 family)